MISLILVEFEFVVEIAWMIVQTTTMLRNIKTAKFLTVLGNKNS